MWQGRGMDYSYRQKGTPVQLKAFAEELRSTRIKAGLSQTQLAEKVGITSVKTINSYEKGVHWPSLGAYAAICVALGLGCPPLIKK